MVKKKGSREMNPADAHRYDGYAAYIFTQLVSSVDVSLLLCCTRRSTSQCPGIRNIGLLFACRKAQRAKEIARNKKERKFQRDAHSLQSNPDAIKDELKEVLALEEDGKGNATVRLKKKALQGAYDNAIKKKKVRLSRQTAIFFARAQISQQNCCLEGICSVALKVPSTP